MEHLKLDGQQLKIQEARSALQGGFPRVLSLGKMDSENLEQNIQDWPSMGRVGEGCAQGKAVCVYIVCLGEEKNAQI